jgi:V/A-type H+-transporting ATPase subunit K
VLILQLLPGTQGIYGLLIAFITLTQIGVMGGSSDLSLTKGLLYFAACMPMAFVGLISAIAQANASISSIALIGKKPDQFGKAMIFPAMVETYAILALLISILSIFGIAGLTV